MTSKSAPSSGRSGDSARVTATVTVTGRSGQHHKRHLDRFSLFAAGPEMDGPFFFTQPNPTHQLVDPTQPTMLAQGPDPIHPSHTYVKCTHQYCRTHIFTCPLFHNYISSEVTTLWRYTNLFIIIIIIIKIKERECLSVIPVYCAVKTPTDCTPNSSPIQAQLSSVR